MVIVGLDIEGVRHCLFCYLEVQKQPPIGTGVVGRLLMRFMTQRMIFIRLMT